MELGSVTLLEINQVPHGKRVAYCLPSGEFIFVADTCAPEFGADKATDLYGGNLFRFLALGDAEKLEDLLRAYERSSGGSLTFDLSNQLRMVVRLVGGSRAALWIHLTTLPITLRMMRCIDAVRSLSNSMGHFADSSSFVLSDDELSSVIKHPGAASMCSGSSSSITPPPLDDEQDDLMLLEYEGSCLSPTSCTPIVPLELKHRRPRPSTMTHHHTQHSEYDKTDAGDDDDLKASLANYAFEADWASEIGRDDAVLATSPAMASQLVDSSAHAPV
ncbi:hypothetical protein BBJ28_00023759 [Nothophytophthora sp. Chile5]|nr:hypothetical protein BBJ28_00023759 [Nothophytophthora sp. Chile5]